MTEASLRTGPTEQDVKNSIVRGSDTRPTAGFNTYLRDQRAGFGREMQQNPQTRLAVAAMAATEHDRDPMGPIEALMNRASLLRRSLNQSIFGHPSFYNPVRTGALQKEMARLQRNPAELAKYNQAIDTVLKGTNLLAGATDQGSGKDPNVNNPSGRIIRFGETYNDFSPGAAAWRRAQQQQVRQSMMVNNIGGQ